MACCSCGFDIILTYAVASKSGHDSSMEQVRAETASRRRGILGALASKGAADPRALALLPTIRKLMAAGFATDLSLANELNRRGITGALGGRWHRSSVRRMLTRLRRLTSAHDGTNNNLAFKPVADLRAEALGPTIGKLRKAGFVSVKAIAQELNKRGIPTPRGGKWHHTTVVRLLTRLGLITLGRGRANNRLAQKQAADARAKALASTIRKLRKAGFVSVRGIVRELNKRQVSALRGGKWHSGTVSRLLRRLDRLGRVSRSQRRR